MIYEIVEGGVNGTGDSGGPEEVPVTDQFETQEAQVMAAAFRYSKMRLHFRY